MEEIEEDLGKDHLRHLEKFVVKDEYTEALQDLAISFLKELLKTQDPEQRLKIKAKNKKDTDNLVKQ
ncbi:hypothetical protein PMALA_049600 [Plasmodium malariae]|uniref:Uncharacterized protein n=1 Tax=Plasmodium malariae TaxID=5858 RepID=A0A1A8WSG5_PLAMA|nr:hypothetical protein PMALA_049600 [Plasmodium malariae]